MYEINKETGLLRRWTYLCQIRGHMQATGKNRSTRIVLCIHCLNLQLTNHTHNAERLILASKICILSLSRHQSVPTSKDPLLLPLLHLTSKKPYIINLPIPTLPIPMLTAVAPRIGITLLLHRIVASRAIDSISRVHLGIVDGN